MNKTKKARSGAVTPEQAREINSETAKDIPGTYNSNNTHKMQDDIIIAILCEGAENAQTAKEMQKILGLSDTRYITIAISRLRQHGVPICASCGKNPGYYIAATPFELQQYLKSLKGRRREIAAVYEGLEYTYNSMTGQQIMEGFNDE